MNKFAILGIAAATIVVVALLGIQLLPRSGGGVGGPPAATPTASPTAAATPAGTVLPSLANQYTSSMHGITVSYPAGWMLQPATEPWTSSELGELTQVSAFADVIFEKEDDSPFIALTSQPLGSKTAEQWTDGFLATRESCAPTQSHTVDGIEGVITSCVGTGGPHAVVVSEGRAFVVWLYRIDDMAYFEQILDSIDIAAP
jgi:hypothetical protein